MIFDVVGLGDLPQRLASVALLPARLPLGFLARLRTRAGLFSPSLDGGLPLFELFKPSRRSSSAILAFKAAFSATSAAICAACALTSAISSSREGSLGDSRIIRFLNRKPSPPSRKFHRPPGTAITKPGQLQ
jgi:hypothetical protein